jgi:hypothetical protein
MATPAESQEKACQTCVEPISPPYLWLSPCKCGRDGLFCQNCILRMLVDNLRCPFCRTRPTHLNHSTGSLLIPHDLPEQVEKRGLESLLAIGTDDDWLPVVVVRLYCKQAHAEDIYDMFMEALAADENMRINEFVQGLRDAMVKPLRLDGEFLLRCEIMRFYKPEKDQRAIDNDREMARRLQDGGDDRGGEA